MIRPFSNGGEYRYWLATNCEGCRKYQPENVMGKGCPIEEALCSASVMDGEISEAIWKRMGKDSGKCTKFTAVKGGRADG